MAKVQNGEEILPKLSTPWVGRRRTNVTDDRHADDRRICDSKDPNVTYTVAFYGIKSKREIKIKLQFDKCEMQSLQL